MKKKAWFLIIGGALGSAIIAFTIFLILHIGMGIIFTPRGPGVIGVSELKAQATSLENQFVVVTGKVVPGSIRQNEAGLIFSITDARETIKVTFKGRLPNNFKPEAEMEIQGSYRPDGTLEAQSFNRPASICIICHG